MSSRLSICAAAFFILVCFAAAPIPARAADFKVFYPDVEQGEFEVENRLFGTADRNRDRGNERNQTAEMGYGITDFWFTEVENEFTKAPRDRWRYESLGLENV